MSPRPSEARTNGCRVPKILPRPDEACTRGTIGCIYYAHQRSNERCEHEWQHRCGKCGEPSEVDGLVETERSSVILALRKICEAAEHDSPIYLLAVEQLSSLTYWGERADKAKPEVRCVAHDCAECAREAYEIESRTEAARKRGV